MKTRMIHLIWVCLFAFIPIISWSQINVNGKVKNEDGEAIPGAKVIIENSYYAALTNENGEFRITNISPGVYTFLVSANGYDELLQEAEVSSSMEALNFELSYASLLLNEIGCVVIIKAVDESPTTFTNLSEREINNSNFGRDLPYLLQSTPSTVVTSDAGAGVGYTGIRIRGVDPTRTNVTVNGIPLNDAESHGVWWVNMPDFSSSVDKIQVQRGVGTSSNGTAAFGASINVKTDDMNREPYAAIDNSFGSFNTWKNTVKVGSGLLNEHFIIDARLSRIVSEGFIDRASSNLKSFFLSGAYIGKNNVLKANVFSGKEKTYQAWWGIPQAKYDEDDDALLTHFYNNYYPGGTYETASDSANLFSSGSNTYNYYWYDNETDNYQQDHYQLHFTQQFKQGINLNIAGFYTRGRGYYEQYKRDQPFELYGFEPIVSGTDTTKTTDLIRRRWLDNHFYGSVFSVSYQPNYRLRIVLGGGVNQYLGNHYGEVIWARNASQSEIGAKYYENSSDKSEVNGYLKANYKWARFNFYGDMQVRNINYYYLGYDQYFAQLVQLYQNTSFLFLNPKVGLNFEIDERSRIYASYSVANREPVRDDFTSSTPTSRPKAEHLENSELGYKFNNYKAYANATIYHMNYRDQLILTGEINDVGAYIRTNVDRSYRAGVELEGGYRIMNNLNISGNFTYSMNKIQKFVEYTDKFDSLWNPVPQEEVTHENTDIAFSPNIIGAVGITYEPLKGLELMILGKYVGAQYLDNTSSEDRKLDAYYIVNTGLTYSFQKWGFDEIKIGVQANNVLNMRYANNGYTWGYLYESTRITENFVYPQAGRNYMVRLSLAM